MQRVTRARCCTCSLQHVFTIIPCLRKNVNTLGDKWRRCCVTSTTFTHRWLSKKSCSVTVSAHARNSSLTLQRKWVNCCFFYTEPWRGNVWLRFGAPSAAIQPPSAWRRGKIQPGEATAAAGKAQKQWGFGRGDEDVDRWVTEKRPRKHLCSWGSIY